MPVQLPANADTRLIRGPYKMPRCRAGSVLYCGYHGDAIVAGITDAPIPWPFWRGTGRHQLPFLCGDLILAVQAESCQAVAHHWGVSRETVRRWRQLLGAPRFNPGTIDLWRRLSVTKLAKARQFRTYLKRRQATG